MDTLSQLQDWQINDPTTEHLLTLSVGYCVMNMQVNTELCFYGDVSRVMSSQAMLSHSYQITHTNTFRVATLLENLEKSGY